MFYQELENKLNVSQGKEVRQIRVESKDFNNVYSWIKRYLYDYILAI
jgi:hypothetical protein